MALTIPQARRIAEELMQNNKSGNDLLWDGWILEFKQIRPKWMGVCEWDCKTISINPRYLPGMSESDLRDTVLHEIAHALTPPDLKSHGKEWRANAVLVGAKPSSTSDIANSEMVRRGYYEPS